MGAAGDPLAPPADLLQHAHRRVQQHTPRESLVKHVGSKPGQTLVEHVSTALVGDTRMCMSWQGQSARELRTLVVRHTPGSGGGGGGGRGPPAAAAAAGCPAMHSKAQHSRNSRAATTLTEKGGRWKCHMSKGLSTPLGAMGSVQSRRSHTTTRLAAAAPFCAGRHGLHVPGNGGGGGGGRGPAAAAAGCPGKGGGGGGGLGPAGWPVRNIKTGQTHTDTQRPSLVPRHLRAVV